MDQFYSFAYAYEEATQDQYSEQTGSFKSNKDQCSRRFRAFLEVLRIDMQVLKYSYQEYKKSKDSEMNIGSLECPNKECQAEIEDNEIIETSFKETVQECFSEMRRDAFRNKFSFNKEMLDQVEKFIKGYVEKTHKNNRRGEFTVKDKRTYQEIISAVKSNMNDLGYPEDMIIDQETIFWNNIIDYSDGSIFDFLEIEPLIDCSDYLKKKKLEISTYAERGDLIYINHMMLEDYNTLLEKWNKYKPRKRKKQGTNSPEKEKGVESLEKGNLIDSLGRLPDDFIYKGSRVEKELRHFKREWNKRLEKMIRERKKLETQLYSSEGEEFIQFLQQILSPNTSDGESEDLTDYKNGLNSSYLNWCEQEHSKDIGMAMELVEKALQLGNNPFQSALSSKELYESLFL